MARVKGARRAQSPLLGGVVAKGGIAARVDEALCHCFCSFFPPRDSEWAQRERQKYSSQAAWDREKGIVHEAGGGELLFAEILNRHADKIIIRNSNFQVPPFWKRIGGFDHGKTNPTAALVTAIDCDGTIYCLGEYYQPGLTPRQHMANLYDLPGFLDCHHICRRSFHFLPQSGPIG